jgi:hypothetical protein
MSFTPVEQEAILLNAMWSMIDDMVNFAVFMPLKDRTQDINLMPKTADTQRLFNVVLGDFLSPLSPQQGGGLPFDLPQPPTGARASDRTFLFYLRQITTQPKLNPRADAIGAPVTAFSDWLAADSYVEDVWLPSIGVELNLTVPRITWLKICGNIGKHSFARLERNVRTIVSILAAHGHSIDEGMGYAVLPEFWQWFHEHLFGYHLSTIAEFLNNIRWGIFEYLQPEFARAYRVTSYDAGAAIYEFDVPAEITAPIAKTMYWDLMNMARSKPYFPRFTVTPNLKLRF